VITILNGRIAYSAMPASIKIHLGLP
jgi:hypothetical protein